MVFFNAIINYFYKYISYVFINKGRLKRNAQSNLIKLKSINLAIMARQKICPGKLQGILSITTKEFQVLLRFLEASYHYYFKRFT